MREVQSQARDEGRQAGQNEERPSRHEGPLPDLRDRTVSDHGVLIAGRTIESHATALLAARAALEKHAEDILVMDLRALSTVTDFFVICTARSAPQLTAIRDHIEATLSRQGGSVWHTEGSPIPPGSASSFDEVQWVLMDCGEVVVHLLDPRARAFYRLEDLWADAPRIPLESAA